MILLVISLPLVTIQVGAQETTTIVCTNSVLADFTAQLITENVTIEYIMPAGACPAHFDTCPSDIALITAADIIISLGWEPWLTSVLAAAENIDAHQIKCTQLGEWNVPSNAKKYVEKISTELSLLFPSLNASLSANANTYFNEINETVTHLVEMIELNRYEDEKVICMQWQKDFVESLGLNVTYSYGPPEGLSTQDMLNASQEATATDIVAIIDNLQSGTEFGSRIASECGASHVIFTNFPGAVPGTETYLEMLTYNTQQLINGITTYEYKQGDIASLEDQLSTTELQRNTAIIIAGIFAVLTLVFIIMYRKK